MTPLIDLENRLLSNSLKAKLIYLNLKNEDLIICIEKLIKANDKPYTSDFLRNFTINDSGALTFLPKNKNSEISEDKMSWTKKNRISGKCGRIFKKLFEQLKIEISLQNIEKLVNHLKAGIHTSNKFEVISGSEIAEIYNNAPIADGCGSLNHSCMNGKYEEYFDIYVNNCKMLISKNEDEELTGRALIWETTCGRKIMDRIYGNDATIQFFKNWAVDKKYLYKAKQNYDYKTTFVGESGEIDKIFKISVNASLDMSFPYIDTFSYAALDLNYITNDIDFGEIIFNETNGEYGGASVIWDDIDDLYINENDAIHIHINFNGFTHISNTVRTYNYLRILHSDSVELFNGDYAYADDEDIRFIPEIDAYVLYDECSLCDWSEEFILDENVIFIEETGETIHKDHEKEYREHNNLNEQATTEVA